MGTALAAVADAGTGKLSALNHPWRGTLHHFFRPDRCIASAIRGRINFWEKAMNELRLFDPLAVDPFEDTFRSLMRPWRMETMEAPRIKLDLHELDTSYTVKAEIPGVRKEDIDVRVDGSTVTISAEVKKEKEEKKEGRLLRRERQEGYASRSFTLACPVNEAEAEAKYENGVLSLTLPKKAANSKKRLSVQ
jgi:HSP20 family protein